MKRLLRGMLCSIAVAGLVSPLARAEDLGAPQRPHVALTYDAGSSARLEQVIGDCDWVAYDATMTLGRFDTPGSGSPGVCKPTASQTASRFDVLGNGLGISFEHRGKLVFLFGDSFGATDSYVNEGFVPAANPFAFAAGDPIAWSDTTRPEDPLVLNFFTQSDGQTPLLVQMPCYPGQPAGTCPANGRVPMGADDVPNAGISLGGQIYIVANTNADAKAADPHAGAFSVLARFDEATQTFQAGRTLSQSYTPLGDPTGSPGHFVFTALHHWPPRDGLQRTGDGVAPEDGDLEPGVLIFGQGQYRASNVYLSFVPASELWSGVDASGQSATRYFTGLQDGRPTWSRREADAVPVVVDDPVDCSLFPPSQCTPGPTVGNASVIYSPELRLWLMTYDGGRQTRATCPGADTSPPNPPSTDGVYFSYAEEPWGPWQPPQLIFNGGTDGGYGSFIYKPRCTPPGPAGPTIGGQDPADPNSNDPTRTTGGAFAPFMIERFTRVDDDTLTITYTLSTWNPDTVVKMRSQFRIQRQP